MLKALSLTQPWASLVAIGAKRIETRSWSTAYRGLLAIHAAKAYPMAARYLCVTEQPFREALLAAGVPNLVDNRGEQSDWPDPMALPRGAIVAVVELVDCIPTCHFQPRHLGDIYQPRHGEAVVFSRQEQAFGDYGPGRYGWLLSSVQRLPIPIPCKGALGLWGVPADVVAAIRAQGVEVSS